MLGSDHFSGEVLHTISQCGSEVGGGAEPIGAGLVSVNASSVGARSIPNNMASMRLRAGIRFG